MCSYLSECCLCMWVMSSEDTALCVADDVSVVCAAASLQHVLRWGFGWTCKKEQQQPQLSVGDGRQRLGLRLHRIWL